VGDDRDDLIEFLKGLGAILLIVTGAYIVYQIGKNRYKLSLETGERSLIGYDSDEPDEQDAAEEVCRICGSKQVHADGLCYSHWDAIYLD